VEQEIGAAVVEDRQNAEFLGNRTKRGRVAAGNDAGEQVDVFLKLKATELLDVGVGAGRLVGKQAFDLALAEQPAFSVDFLGRQKVPLASGIAQQVGRTSQEGHVRGLERLVGNISLDLGSRIRRSRS